MGLLFVIFIVVLIIILVTSLSEKQIKEREQDGQIYNNTSNYNTGRSNYPSIRRERSLVDNFDDFWIMKEDSVEVNGYTISNGMVYVGKNLSSIIRDYYGEEVEPALINPEKPINRNQPDYEGHNFGYWPNYEGIPPESRAAYLEWLASDRNDPDTPLGYVFLYYYGLERRILYDSENSARAKNELSELISEVKRLLSIYGPNNSFRRYATGLLEFKRLTTETREVFKTAIENENLNFPEYYGRQYEYSLNFKIGLAFFAKKEMPLPADWALKWGVSQISMRTPATRCKEKFQILFRKKYEEKFGEGLILKPNKTNIKISYRPASRSFGYNTFTAKTNLPDLTALNAPVKEIRKLIDECTDLLDPYSRYLGRNPDDKDSIEAISNLPKELLKETLTPKLKEFIHLIDTKLGEEKFALLKTGIFTNYWEIKGVNKYRKRESIEIAQFLFKLGYGIEPDLRFGSAKFERDSRVILFRVNPETFPKAPSKEYRLALPILHLTSVVGLADGTLTPEEEQHIDEYIEEIFQLTEKEKIRLNAYLNWLKAENPGVIGLKNKIKNLKQNKRESILQFLIKIADVDGYISPGEVETLQKIAEIFEIEPEKVYTAIHKRQTVQEDPMLIVKGENKKGFAIPKEQETSGGLDKKIVDKTLKETEKVQSILSDIFVEEDEAEESKEIVKDDQHVDAILGLDELHSNLLKQLFSQPNWNKVEYEHLCSEQGLFSDGALELINEKAFDEFDDVLLIESDQLELNMEIVNKLA